MTKSIQELFGVGKFAEHGTVAKFMKLGYQTVDELIATASVEPKLTNEFASFDVEAELRKAGFLPERIKMFLAEASLTEPHQLGVLLENIKTPPFQITYRRYMYETKAAVLPERVSLVPQLPAIKNQGRRGTCVAFATAAALEKATDDYSEQFIYNRCKTRDGHPTSAGTWLGVSFPSAKDDGICRETTWRYNPNPVAGNEGQDPAPPAALKEAASSLHDYEELFPTSVAEIKEVLARGRVVSFSVPVYNSWVRNPEVDRTGNIVMPLPGEKPVGGHAMAIVGYYPDLLSPGSGRFEIRNSWGTTWARESPLAAGYGTMPYDYIANHCKEAYYFRT